MRNRGFSVLTVVVLALAVAASFEPAAGAKTPGITASHSGRAIRISPQSTAGFLYSQDNNDAGVEVVSQNFEKVLNEYDGRGADSFDVPAGATWTVRGINVTGQYFNCTPCGPAVSERVAFYQDSGGRPGAVIKGAIKTGLDNGTGSFKIRGIKGLTLTTGTYWVSVQANMDLTNGGEWGWETRSVQSGAAAVWRNPGDGFLTGCTVYANMQSCIGPQGEGPDFMFALIGTSS